MLFNSVEFLVFFAAVVVLYFTIRHEYRWILLLASSYFFYMTWNAGYAILILTSTLIIYFSALFIQKTENIREKKAFLAFGLLTNLGILFAFKYFNFFNESVSGFLSLFGLNFSPIVLDIILPLGISFYTFHALSYMIDVYTGDIKAESHLGIFALYISFFPQLIAGPIGRAGSLLPQFFERHNFSQKNLTDGLKLMLWGFFLKMVIADRLAVIVDQVYHNVGNYTGFPLIAATIFFAYQIYADFAGYSFIAIGAALVIGFRLMDNFKRPYFSSSISEFWRRWHISLSTWFRDYLYIPLGGSRKSASRRYLNLFIVFLITGLWHGAHITFVIWGLLHGFYIILSLATKNQRENVYAKIGIVKKPRLHKAVKIFVTFALVNLAWIFFRAKTVGDASYVITHMFSVSGIAAWINGIGIYTIIIAAAFVAFMETVHAMQSRVSIRLFLSDKPTWLRWGVYLIAIAVILLFGVFSSREFIYFQF